MLKRYVKALDYKLLVVIGMLCMIGIIMVYSSSSIIAIMKFHKSEDYFLKSQVISMIAGIILFFVCSCIPHTIFKKRLFILGNLTLSVGLLLLVLVIGKTANNAQSWINLGGIRFQPTEFIKIGIIVMLSCSYAKKQQVINKFWAVVVPPLGYIGLIFILI